MKTWLVSVGISFALATNAYAVENRLPGQIDNLPRVPEIPKSLDLDAPQKAPLEQAPQLEAPATDRVVIEELKKVIFEGVTVLSKDKLTAVISPYLNKRLGEQDLAKLKYDATQAFFEAGYIVVRVISPPQEFADGILKLRVYEARVADKEIYGNDVIYPWVVRDMANQVKQGEVVKESRMESMISDIDDLQGVKATLNLKPGKAVGTTDFDILIDKKDEDVQTLTVDNYGSELTGKNVASAHFEKSNLLNFGEQYTLDLRHSDDELWGVGLGLNTPIGVSNIHLETSYQHSKSEIGGFLSDLNAVGTSDIVDVALSSKLLNSRTRQVTLRGGVNVREHESTQFDERESKDHIRDLYIENTYLQRNPSSVFYGGWRLMRGIEAFGATEKGDLEATRSEAVPNAWIFEPTLFTDLKTSENGILTLLATGRMASDILLSSELLTLGGYDSVRGFDVAQEAAESGGKLTAEYSHNLLAEKERYTLNVGPFVDAGLLYNRVPGTIVDKRLYSAGLGMEFQTDKFSNELSKLRFDWARPIGPYKSLRVDDDTFYLRLSHSF